MQMSQQIADTALNQQQVLPHGSQALLHLLWSLDLVFLQAISLMSSQTAKCRFQPDSLEARIKIAAAVEFAILSGHQLVQQRVDLPRKK